MARKNESGVLEGGDAADILIAEGEERERLYAMAEAHGFNGIGRYPWGLHIDLRETPARW